MKGEIMKIEDVKVQVISRDKDEFKSGDIGFGIMKRMAETPVLTITTDDGIEGISFGTDGMRQAQYLASLRPFLIGQDPMLVEKLWQEMWNMSRRATFFTESVIGTIDIAIWDIIGKVAGLPLYKLLGAYRNKVKSYASVMPTGEAWQVDDYARHALECKARGFTAYKIHARGGVDEHLAVCRAVREAVGDDMVLMLDPTGQYDRREALIVGRELEKLNFYWLEDPIPDTDIEGLSQLSQALDIPITALEALPGNMYTRAQHVARSTVDMIRGDVIYCGGVTPLKKMSSMAEAFGMNCEIHLNSNPLAQAANLHVMCSISNCDFFEWMVPEWLWDYGVKDSIKLDDEGFVYVPEKPGLGLEADKEYIESHTTATL